MNPLAISGTRRALNELVDGTVRVQIDIDPECRKAFFALFPEIDTRVALAPLHSEAKAAQPKGGELARLAGMLCSDAQFQAWIENTAPNDFLPSVTEAMGITAEGRAAITLRNVCGIESRAELDNDARAAAIFRQQIYDPFNEFRA